jgi:hypothetical protein
LACALEGEMRDSSPWGSPYGYWGASFSPLWRGIGDSSAGAARLHGITQHHQRACRRKFRNGRGAGGNSSRVKDNGKGQRQLYPPKLAARNSKPTPRCKLKGDGRCKAPIGREPSAGLKQRRRPRHDDARRVVRGGWRSCGRGGGIGLLLVRGIFLVGLRRG